MTNLIYQVGRITGEPKTFFISSQQGKFCLESELSSFFLKEYMKSKQERAEVVLIYPVSILLNKGLPEMLGKRNLNDSRQKVQKILEEPDKYLNSPDSYIREIPCEKNRDDILVVHSLGTYAGITLNGFYDDIVLELFFDMVKRYLKYKQVQAIYLDISSGLNIYVSAMIEAARYFSTFVTLMNWKNDTNSAEDDTSNIPEIIITFSDPIIGNDSSEYEIHLQKQIYLETFMSPLLSYFKKTYQSKTLSEDELNKLLKDNIYSDKNERPLKNQLKEKLLKSLLIYSSITNCTPLYLYYIDRHTDHGVFKEIETIIDYAEKKLYLNYRESPKLNKEFYIEVICQLALYAGMLKILKNKIEKFDQDTGIRLKDLGETFEKILSNIGFNRGLIFLKNEVDITEKNINEYFEKNKNETEKWIKLREIKFPDSKSTLNKRNFIAHIGLAAEITEIKKDKDGEIYVRYSETIEMNKLDKFLLESN